MKYKKLISFLAFFLAVLSVYGQNPFVLKSGEPVTVACGNSEEEVVHTALNLLNRDVESVFSTRIIVTPESKKGMIIVGTIGQSNLIDKAGVDLSPIKNKKEAFLLTVSSNGKLVIAGSDKRGTAYGVMELSRLIGVSPWEWWADATPAKKEIFQLPASYRNVQSPSVEYRGIFINDEDWGLTPWSWQTYEPSDVKGQIGPKTHERIFELLLRLRANTFWPAMHGCSVPFYFTPGNKEVADKFGIFIGTSHCEPMMRNTNGEWKRDGVGEYDYVHNSAHVLSFWEQRVKEVAELDNLYTLGMRGVHDGAMNGAKTIEEQKAVLTKVLKDQRDLLTKYVNKDVTQVPQVFIPYKEVLDVYHAGLQVPDEVTLMWCDDNYGYIRHFPTAEERARKGGNGVYYHVSYWACERGIQKMWILNVGDIKPAEYQVELFLDMAWNLEAVKQQGVAAHQRHFLEREFGKNRADRLQPVMQEAYRLAYIRKPEFMGNTRTEEKDPKFKVISDLPWCEQEINERLAAYRQLSDKVEQEWHALPAQKKETYFQLVKYPVQAAAQMNNKLLTAQLARHGKADWADSDRAYDSIVSLTKTYNTTKWNRMMDFQPRRLLVFNRVERKALSSGLLEKPQAVYTWNGADCVEGASVICEGLGYEGKAVAVEKKKELTFEFAAWETDSVEVEVRLLPNHPVEGERLRFTISLDGSATEAVSYETKGRSEEWKENVLCNQAVRRMILPVARKASHRLIFTALDEGVVLDQICLYMPRIK